MTTAEAIQLAGVCGSILIGGGGVAVALMTLYWNYKGRTAHYRQSLYTKQIEGYVEVYQALWKFHSHVQNFICHVGCVLKTDEQRVNLRVSGGELGTAVWQVWSKWMLLLPEEMNEAIGHFQRVCNAISAPSAVGKYHPQELVNSGDPGMALSKAFVAVVQVARKHIGTDPLTEEVVKIWGSSQERQDQD